MGKSKKYEPNIKKTYFVILIGLLAFGGWFLVFSIVCNAMFYGNGQALINVNNYNEMVVEFFLFLSFMVISLIFIFYIYGKGVK